VRRMVALLALVALLAVNLRWAEPYYDWDLLGYSGVAARIGGATPAEAHRRVYDLAYRNVPPEQYAWLVEGGEFQQAVAADPAAFEQQLPFYRLEPAYPLLILALDRLGVDPVHGSVWISRVAYLGIGVVAFVWLSGFLSPLAALATAWGAMSVQVALEAARLPTPDALSALVVLTALWLVFECQHFGRGMLVLLLSLLIRPDNLLWILGIAGWRALRVRRDRAVAALGALAGVAVSAALRIWSGSFGWRVSFHHSFVEPLPYPEQFVPSLGFSDYAWIYLRETHPANLPLFAALFALLGAWLLVSRARRFGWRDAGTALIACTGAYAVTHWLVFPNDDRLRLAAYLVVLILLVRTLAGAATRRMPGDAVRFSAPRSLRLTGLPRLEALLGRRAGPGA